VFTRSGSTWSQQGSKLTASGATGEPYWHLVDEYKARDGVDPELEIANAALGMCALSASTGLRPATEHSHMSRTPRSSGALVRVPLPGFEPGSALLVDGVMRCVLGLTGRRMALR
jgi:hypothetical protein